MSTAHLKELEKMNKLVSLYYYGWFFRYIFQTAQTRYIGLSAVAVTDKLHIAKQDILLFGGPEINSI